MDPKHWDNPTLFDPERHIKDGKIQKNPAFMPFSVGMCVCCKQIYVKCISRFLFTYSHDYLVLQTYLYNSLVIPSRSQDILPLTHIFRS